MPRCLIREALAEKKAAQKRQVEAEKLKPKVKTERVVMDQSVLDDLKAMRQERESVLAEMSKYRQLFRVPV